MTKTLEQRGLARKRQYPAGRSPRNAPNYDRILRHVREDENGCWVWTADRDAAGYGRLKIDGRSGLYAHRVSYEAFVAPVPDGLVIDHLCGVKACCNPFGHLEPVLHEINVRRARPDVCPVGHPFSADNTRRYGGTRVCVTCRRAYARLYAAMTPEERAERKRAGLPVVDLAAYFAEQNQEQAA